MALCVLFYESLINLAVFALLFTFMWKFKKKPSGLAMCGYFFCYGLTRSIMEPLRDSQYILGYNIPVSLVFSIIMCVGGAVCALALLYCNRRKYGLVIGAAEGEPLAILPQYFTKEQLKKMEEEKLAKAKAAKAVQEKRPPRGVLRCPECGAKIVAEGEISKCPYCGSPIQLPAQSDGTERADSEGAQEDKK